MSGRISNLITRISRKRALNRWERIAGSAPQMDLAALRKTRSIARKLRQRLDMVINLADSRLLRPVIGRDTIRQPKGSDWAFRPEIWRTPVSPSWQTISTGKTAIGGQAKIFHDSKINEMAMRQIRNMQPQDLAPFGLRLDVFAFDGSFLSVALDLPEQAVQGMSKKHLLRLEAIIEMENPVPIFARLNIKCGPNTDQVGHDLPLTEAKGMVEFDLSYTKLTEAPADQIWLDLIVGKPAMNRITLRDITFSRLPRAEL